MPRLNNLKVVTFSSEDPGQPASNLARAEQFRKWKCMSEGEKEASVVLKNETAVQITSLDLGNNGSAFVEVHVGRSGSHPQEYEILLSSFAFMSPLESRSWTNTSRVRMFNSTMLNKNVLAQKWDLFKFVCTQPFNTHVQYGLTFVYINAMSDIVEPKVERTIGNFRMLAPSGDDESDAIKVGSLFSKKKNPTETEKSATSTAVTIRQASAALLASSTGSPKGQAQSLLGKRKLADDAEDFPSQSAATDRAQKLPNYEASSSSSSSDERNARKTTGNPGQSSKTPVSVNQSPKVSVHSKRTLTTNNPSNGSPKMGSNSAKVTSSRQSTSTKTKQPASQGSSIAQKKTVPPKPKRARIRKPFNKLLEDVVFTISGYENPYRTTMRRKAIEMGATCKPDWDQTCTHLICAFVNTPKFRFVRSSSSGKIVKMKWIEDCYIQRRRLRWRKYWLDSRDNISDSEEEIDALSEPEIDTEEAAASSSSSDTVVLSDKDKNTEEIPNIESESELSEEEGVAKTHPPRFNRLVVSSTEDEADEYENETDGKEIEMDEDKSDPEITGRKASSTSPSRRQDFFRYLNFCLDPEMTESVKVSISGIIFHHKGTVAQVMDDSVEYFVTDAQEWKEAFSERLSENPSLTFVTKEFITQCAKLGNMASPSEFMLLPV